MGYIMIWNNEMIFDSSILTINKDKNYIYDWNKEIWMENTNLRFKTIDYRYVGKRSIGNIYVIEWRKLNKNRNPSKMIMYIKVERDYIKIIYTGKSIREEVRSRSGTRSCKDIGRMTLINEFNQNRTQHSNLIF